MRTSDGFGFGDARSRNTPTLRIICTQNRNSVDRFSFYIHALEHILIMMRYSIVLHVLLLLLLLLLDTSSSSSSAFEDNNNYNRSNNSNKLNEVDDLLLVVTTTIIPSFDEYLLSSTSRSRTSSSSRHNMNQFKKYDEKYENEYQFRKTIYERNVRKIQKHNHNPNKTYKLGLNQFTDMLEHEIHYG